MKELTRRKKTSLLSKNVKALLTKRSAFKSTTQEKCDKERCKLFLAFRYKGHSKK